MGGIVKTTQALSKDDGATIPKARSRSDSSQDAGASDDDRIVSGRLVSPQARERLARALGVSDPEMQKIIWLAGARPEPTAAIILAGGESRRMGRDKALLKIGKFTMIEHLARQLAGAFDEILVAGPHAGMALSDQASSGSAPSGSAPFGLKFVPDLEAGQGPLMGIVSALQASSARVNFIIACDIPEVNLRLAARLLSESVGAEIVVPSFQEGTREPLFGVYKKDVVSRGLQILKQGKRRIIELYPLCETKIIRCDDHAWYTNMNTPEDYRQYIRQRSAPAADAPAANIIEENGHETNI